ncbi:magnesium transporter CorA family protein [Treponema parvum]|uniref:Magnesium transporter CorA family protein n=1 Tax=Treponema parvum TaxID=138851 RepID=A0A975F0M4_9SPIR|nr:magnesium transporter CorA family protein [Treponema parvum]QTQ12276.1 magnesium transporter CorA family protein [Treponema parvum]QTQ15742.1 magnesium transporter CorA family protein [Treponema parvum]
MITYWQQVHGKLIRVKKEDLDPKLKTWVDARSVTTDDISELENDYLIENEHILDILDPDELSRIEAADEYILVIMRLPIFEINAEIPYFTIPLGVIIKDNFIITICWTDCEVLKDFSANRVKGARLEDFPAFMIQILSRSDILFLRYLKEINRRSASIQKELQVSIENKEIIQLLNLEKSLEFFTTSLSNNQVLLEKFRKTKLLKLDEDDQDWLDDVDVDNRQAIDMADTYSNILSGMMDAFASVISNNLNIVMKKLTIINIILMIPTFIVSFFGMNIPLPFQNSGGLGIIVIIFICIVSTMFARILFGDRSSLQQVSPALRKKAKERKNKKRQRGDSK